MASPGDHSQKQAGLSVPSVECEASTPTVEVNEGQIALRVSFPLLIDSVNPMGNPQTMPYNIRTVLKSQISSFIPGILRDNYIDKQCDVIVVPIRDGYYLKTTFPEIFTQYYNP